MHLIRCAPHLVQGLEEMIGNGSSISASVGGRGAPVDLKKATGGNDVVGHVKTAEGTIDSEASAEEEGRGE